MAERLLLIKRGFQEPGRGGEYFEEIIELHDEESEVVDRLFGLEHWGHEGEFELLVGELAPATEERKSRILAGVKERQDRERRAADEKKERDRLKRETKNAEAERVEFLRLKAKYEPETPK